MRMFRTRARRICNNCKIAKSKLKDIMNRHLPASIRIKQIIQVDKSFHSRFHAKKRVYRYFVSKKDVSVFNAKYISSYKEFDEELTFDMSIEDLALDSIATMEMVGFLEDKTEKTFPDEELAQVNSIKDLASLVKFGRL